MFDLAGVVASFGGVVWTLAFFVIALSIIVAVHEYGHYIVGRWTGIHAEVFSIGFGPTLASRVDQFGTVWQLAALPFGGYVKFKGDANAASAPELDGLVGMSAIERRSTMQGAPIWARAATVLAGPVFNFMFSILLFCALAMFQGRPTDDLIIVDLPNFPIEYDIQVGDQIVAIDGKPALDLAALSKIADTLTPAAAIPYTVMRDGDQLNVSGPFPRPAVVSRVQPQSAAISAGLKAGDVITKLDGMPVYSFEELRTAVKEGQGETIEFEIWRNGVLRTISITPRHVDIPAPGGAFEKRWLVGVSGGAFFENPTVKVGLFEALPAAAYRTWSVITGSVSGMWNLITGAISTCNLSGPITIAKASGQVASMGTISFLSFVAILSTAVGLLNLFPIPMLDGGHLVFHAYEAVTGRPPSDRIVGFLMTAGLALVMSVMALALMTDILC